MNRMADILLAIDGNSLMHRAYWALPPMSDKEGRPTNAVYGFFTMLFRIVDEYAPNYIAVAFDRHEPTFRHEKFAAYKAGRRKTPEDLIAQFPILKDALKMAGVRYAEQVGYEADDILGALAQKADMQTFIFTGDRDELQLISDTTAVVLTKKGVTETKLMTEHSLREDMGITPSQITDLKGLMGDASDNIPGIAGVGEKTALKLLYEYGTVEDLYAHIDELPKNKLYEKLMAGKQLAFLSKELATIHTEMPLEARLEEFAFPGFDLPGLEEMCRKYEFRNFMKRFDFTAPAAEKRQAEQKELAPDELTLFEDATEFAFLLTDEGLHFAIDGQTDYIIRTKQTLLDEGYDLMEILQAVRPYFNGRRVITHDVKSYMHELSQYEIRIRDYFDTMLAAWVLSPSYPKYTLEDVMKRAELPKTAAAIFELSEAQARQIQENELEQIYYEIEIPLLTVLFEMEENGFYVSREELLELGKKYQAQIELLTKEIYEMAGTEFNISSTKQLADVLFLRLMLPAVKKTKTGYSTDIEVLEKLEGKHPVIGKIMEYRQLTKLKGTYVDGLVALIRNGYIHTTFLQTATATGRLSSMDPNLQNIPIKSQMANDIRQAFLAPEGDTIVSADYSQIELRILAVMADDDSLKRAFLNGEDIHARTAAEILDKQLGEVTKAERANAKAVNFGIVYGISDFGLARNTGLSRKEAARYIERYLQEFSGVRRYMEEIKARAHEDGYVRTMFGRIRYIPELASGNYNIRSAGERAALNTPIQGTAADIMKIAMNKTARRLEGMGSKLVLQVHDELIVYAKQGEEELVREILKDCMENAVQLPIPLAVNVAAGKTWLEAK